jgi:uncharacterized membrane protein YedE/YeeE
MPQVAPPKAPESTLDMAVAALVASVCGLIWGIVFEKSRVFEIGSIRGQFLFERFVMLKLFMSAMGVSAFAITLTALKNPALFDEIRDKFRAGCQRGVVSGAAFGAFILGVGMALSAACPGMVLSQIGAGQENSIYTIIGGLVGCVVYASVEKMMRDTFITRGYIFPKDKRFADEFLGVGRDKTPYMIAGLGVFALGAGIVMDLVVPWDNIPGESASDSMGEIDFANGGGGYGGNDCGGNPLKCRAWNPLISGSILGALQIILISKFGTCTGSATAYQSIVAAPLLLVKDRTKMVEERPWMAYLNMFTPASIALQWQIFYCVFSCIGAFVSATMSGTFGDAPGLDPVSCFLGGFLMLFGGRLAGGCTSSHGISGFPMLQNTSIVAVPAMFAGGIVLSFIIKGVVGDDVYPSYRIN